MGGPGRGRGRDAQREIIYGVIAAMMGVSLGVGLRAVASAANAQGSPRGGASVFPLVVGGLLFVFGEALLARRRVYAALVLFPLALIAGFVALGGF